MRFAHCLEEFANDEGFLLATYQAGLQVERLKALEKAWDSTQPPKTEDKKKETHKKDKLQKKKLEPTGLGTRPERKSP